MVEESVTYQTKPLELACNWRIKQYAAQRKPSVNSMRYAVNWLPTGCNQRCVYCATEGWKKDENPLSFNEILSVIKQEENLGVKLININGSGEPFLYPRIKEVIKEIRDCNIDLRITTNMTLITEELAKELYRQDVTLIGKLHTADDPSLHDAFVEMRGGHKRVLKSLNNLMKAGYPDVEEREDRILTKLGLMTMLAVPFYSHTKGVLEYCKEKQIYPMLDGMVVGGQLDYDTFSEWALSEEQEAALAEDFRAVMGYSPKSCTDICSIEIPGLFIGREGRVYADSNGSGCDALADTDFGSVRERSLEDIWAGLWALRQKNWDRVSAALDEHNHGKQLFQCWGMIESQKRAGQNETRTERLA